MGLMDRFKKAIAGSEPQVPAVKPGRNEPCWCGSGRKYKKCHLPDEERKAGDRACSLHCGPS